MTKLGINHENKDRNYMFGRLLGAIDKLEESAINNGDARTVSVHLQNFSVKPFTFFEAIFKRVSLRMVFPHDITLCDVSYKELQKVFNEMIPSDYSSDAPLNGDYIIGYYHERAYIDSLVSIRKGE